MTFRQAAIAAIFVFSPLYLVGCGQGGDGDMAKSDEDEEEVVTVPVEVARVAPGTVRAAFAGTATLEADREADVVAKAAGVILEIMVEEGDSVKEGQLVARLDRDRLNLQVQQSRAALSKLENDFARTEELYNKRLISKDAYDKVRYDYDAQRASVEMAELELSYTEVRAPISGVISERLVKEGNLVNLYQPLFRIDDFDPLLAVMYVPERELVSLKVGQTARLQLDALGAQGYMGKLARISPTIDPATGTFKATIEIPSPDTALMPGMFGRVDVVHDVRENVLTVPRNALIIEDRSAFVYRVEGKRSVRQDVTLGYETDGIVEILDGLDEGAVVVTSGKGSIGDGTQLDVIGGDPEAVATAQAQELVPDIDDEDQSESSAVVASAAAGIGA